MREHRLGLLPVADAADRFVGVLTERALLVRLTPRRPRRWWEALIDDHDRPALDRVRATGTRVGDLMETAPIAIVPEASVEARSPVVADGGGARLGFGR
jgi:CBS domain-containing protein